MPGGQDGVLSTGPWKGGWQRTSRSAQADKGRCRGPGTGPAQHVQGPKTEDLTYLGFKKEDSAPGYIVTQTEMGQ